MGNRDLGRQIGQGEQHHSLSHAIIRPRERAVDDNGHGDLEIDTLGIGNDPDLQGFRTQVDGAVGDSRRVRCVHQRPDLDPSPVELESRDTAIHPRHLTIRFRELAEQIADPRRQAVKLCQVRLRLLDQNKQLAAERACKLGAAPARGASIQGQIHASGTISARVSSICSSDGVRRSE